MYIHIQICIWKQLKVVHEFVREQREWYKEGLEGEKQREKLYNYVIVSKIKERYQKD